MSSVSLLDRFGVAQGDLELTDSSASVPSPEIKGLYHHSMVSRGLAMHSDLQASFIC